MTLADILDWHLRHYPLLQARDIYKLIHQGVFGPGHLIEDEEHARRALTAEFDDISRRCCMQAMERTEPLDPDGRLVRVNLETLRDVPDATERVLGVLIETARIASGTPEMAARRLTEAVEWCVRELPEQSGVLATMSDPSQGEGFPILHHSRVYRTAYSPAYRVLARGMWGKADPGDAGDATCRPGAGWPPPPFDTTG